LFSARTSSESEKKNHLHENLTAHGLWSSAGSAAPKAFSMMTYKPGKLGQTNVVFGL